MLMISRRWTSLALTALTLATSAHAATAPSSASTAQTKKPASTSSVAAATNTSSTSTSSSAVSSFLKDIGVSYLGILSGPSLSSPASVYLDDADHSPTSITNRFTISKPLFSDYKMGLRIQARTAPTLGTTLLDPVVVLSKGSLYANGNYNLSGDVRLRAGVSSGSQAAGNLMGFQMTQVQDYQFGNSRFSGSVQTVEAFSLFNDFSSKAVAHVEAYPSVSYSLNPKVALSAGSTIGTDYLIGGGLQPVGYDLDLGGDLTLGKNVTLSPSVNLPIQSGVTLQNTTLNAYLSWRLL